MHTDVPGGQVEPANHQEKLAMARWGAIKKAPKAGLVSHRTAIGVCTYLALPRSTITSLEDITATSPAATPNPEPLEDEDTAAADPALSIPRCVCTIHNNQASCNP